MAERIEVVEVGTWSDVSDALAELHKDERPATHRMRCMESVHGVARDGVITCECGWTFKYDRVVNGLAEHARHAQSHTKAVN